VSPLRRELLDLLRGQLEVLAVRKWNDIAREPDQLLEVLAGTLERDLLAWIPA